MTSITVRVGREEKEISGLTKRTTCWDVVLALLKDKQNISGTEGFSADGERQNSAGGDETGSASSNSSKSIKELAQSYCVVESWRGWEKPIPPRTRILHVMQALEKQRGQVQLSLKKSKHIAYNNSHQRQSDFKVDSNGYFSPSGDGTDPSNYISRLSHHQKRRIRRNLKQYKRAVLSKSTNGREDFINNNRLNADNLNSASSKTDKITLSEELFVDGVICDTLVRPDREELISQGTFNQEYCVYRRRGRHHRRGSEDSVNITLGLHRDSVPHFPYSHHHRRKRARKSVSSKRHRRNCRRYSTDDTSTTTTTATNSSEEEEADDADDEKSVLTEHTFTNNTRLLRQTYSPSLVPCLENVISNTIDLSTTATDSSTTTSGDSVSSNGCSTSSGSSEASSWGDCALDRSIREYCANKGVNFKPGVIQPPQRFLKNSNTNNVTEEPQQKPKKSKFILGNMSFKPAQNFIETLRRSNSKRQSKSNKKSQSQSKQKNANSSSNKSQEIINKSPHPTTATDAKTTEHLFKDKEDVLNEDKPTDSLSREKPLCIEGPDEDSETRDEILLSLLAQQKALQSQKSRLAESDLKIENIETDIHQLRERAHGKNYVQESYMSENVEQESTDNSMAPTCGLPVSTKWILECDQVDMLEEFNKVSSEIINAQIKIEEYQRKVDIVLQDMQEEVWRVSAEGCSSPSKVSATAALLFGQFEEVEDASDDETRHESLSVSNSSSKTDTDVKNEEIKTTINKPENSSMEIETLRTELETSLYFSLRLNAELEEVDHRLGASDNLIQRKGEELIRTVRDIAMSDEGISPDMWEEYGELLTAYDLEVQHREYLGLLDAMEQAAACEKENNQWNETEVLHIDATSPIPTLQPAVGLQSDNVQEHMPVNVTTEPCAWCEHCKLEESMKSQQQHSHVENSHRSSPFVMPRSFSELPLPYPKLNAPSPVPLLPMPPISTEDSDYEDINEINKTKSVGANITSTSNIIEGKPFHNSDILLPSSNNSTDDSGNASAESTSSDGSRNSSCDGGSPRPYPDGSNTNAFFSGRGGWKDKFPFSSQRKSDNQNHTTSSKYSKTPPPIPPQSTKPTLTKRLPPQLPPKPTSMSNKGHARRSSTSSPAPPLQTFTQNSGMIVEHNTLQQQQKLIRRNTGGRGKTRMTVKPPPVTNGFPNNNLNTFGVRGGSFRDNRIKYNLSLPIINNSSRCTTPVSVIGSGLSIPPKQNIQEKSRLTNYDNDSDTGLSSLHSTDSDQIIYSETLV